MKLILRAKNWGNVRVEFLEARGSESNRRIKVLQPYRGALRPNLPLVWVSKTEQLLRTECDNIPCVHCGAETQLYFCRWFLYASVVQMIVRTMENGKARDCARAVRRPFVVKVNAIR